MLRLVILGMFLSVFVHAGVELAAALGAIPEVALMPVMGTLLSAGSLAFFAAGIVQPATFRTVSHVRVVTSAPKVFSMSAMKTGPRGPGT